MKKRKTLILMLSLVCLLVVGIGFAAVTRTLSVTGSIGVKPNDTAFVVEFETGTGYTIDSEDSKKADITIAASDDFVAVNDTKTVTLVIGNNSTQNYSAKLNTPTITYTSGEGEIEVTTNAATAFATNLAKEATVNLVVTIKLVKAQIDTTTFQFSISFTADAVQG